MPTEHDHLITLPTRLRKLAMNTQDVLSKSLIRDLATDIENIVLSVAIQPTDDNMKTLNCAWARATRLLSMQPNSKDAA